MKELCQQDVFAHFSEFRGAFYVAKTKSGEVHRRDMSDEALPEFEAAIEKEVKSMLYQTKAVAPLTLNESQDARAKFPVRIMRSRYQRRWMPIGDVAGVTRKAKARWVVLGFEDQDVLHLESSSPTSHLQTSDLLLSIRVGLRQEIDRGDLEEPCLPGQAIKMFVYFR